MPNQSPPGRCESRIRSINPPPGYSEAWKQDSQPIQSRSVRRSVDPWPSHTKSPAVQFQSLECPCSSGPSRLSHEPEVPLNTTVAAFPPLPPRGGVVAAWQSYRNRLPKGTPAGSISSTTPALSHRSSSRANALLPLQASSARSLTIATSSIDYML